MDTTFCLIWLVADATSTHLGIDCLGGKTQQHTKCALRSMSKKESNREKSNTFCFCLTDCLSASSDSETPKAAGVSRKNAAPSGFESVSNGLLCNHRPFICKSSPLCFYLSVGITETEGSDADNSAIVNDNFY